MTQDLFSDTQANPWQPLADRMRPAKLSEYIGQQHILGADKPLRKAIENGQLYSMIFWGPPGTGKTTLARLLANHVNAEFLPISAVLSGVKDIRQAIERAQQTRSVSGRGSILFVDEVHRFNKAQQDAFLPYVEDGTVVFIGATTENPSFELNNALLSRARVYVLKSLELDDLIQVIDRAVADSETGLGELNLSLDQAVKNQLAVAADGDARRLLNLLEMAADLTEEQQGTRVIDNTLLAEVLKGSPRRYDKQGDIFYDQISAFHKSVRGSSPDGALYWMARMIDGGCDPLYIARRLLAIASEDIGNADPRALQITVNAWDAFERLGPQEGNRAIAHAAVYCACAAKSNAVHTAYKAALEAARDSGSHEVPLHLRNAPTKLMAELDYGAEYRYAHDEPHGYAAGESYFPDSMTEMTFYHPTERGLEGRIKDKLEQLAELDRNSPVKRRQ